jgi:hypothetical protein
MRAQVAALIVEGDLFAELVKLAKNPAPYIRLRAIAPLASYVLPRLQSTEVVRKQDPEDLKFQQELQTKLDGIRAEMAQARQIVYVQEGEIAGGDTQDDGTLHGPDTQGAAPLAIEAGSGTQGMPGGAPDAGGVGARAAGGRVTDGHPRP